IALGRPRDKTFLNLKNYDLNPERMNIGWMSNNTAVFKTTEQFELIPEIAERIFKNGEPGFFNQMNVRRFGRVGTHFNDHDQPEVTRTWSREYEQDQATLVNPCSEIPLESSELCNLAEVFPSRCIEQRDG